MTDETGELIRLSFFTDIARSIAAANTLDETLDQVMRHVREIFSPRNWSLLLRDGQTGDLVFTVVAGGDEANQLRGTHIPPDSGIAGWIVQHRSPLVIEDVTVDPRFDPSIDRMLNFTTKSIIGVPLISRDRVFGVIELINRIDGERFSALDLKILTTIADFAAVAIEKAYYLKALRTMALQDDLTGLANRRALSRALDREAARSKRTRSTTALMVVDIDDFKAINDRHGHPAGDAVLKHLASILRQNVREMDVVCRYGGDEFTVLMPDTTAEQADEVRNRVQDSLRREHGKERTGTVAYGISIGIQASGPDEIDSLFDGADLHLYREKEQKREQTIEEISDHITDFVDGDLL